MPLVNRCNVTVRRRSLVLRLMVLPLLLLSTVPVNLRAQPADVDAKHVKVYYEPGRFGGWPANHGIWSWGNEILVGFGRGYHKDLGNSHNIDRERPEDHLLARSLDGGETWSIEDPSRNGDLIPAGDHMFGTLRPGIEVPPANNCPGGIDFTHPDFAMTLRMFGEKTGHSWLFYSYDRGRHWQGPFEIPIIGTPGIEARTNYIVNGKHDCTLFLSTTSMAHIDGKGIGKRSVCARTTDGGKSWRLISWIGPPLAGNAIMPTAARLSETDIVCVLRRRDRPKAWLAAFSSQDNGASWQRLAHPVSDTGVGNPASLIKLDDSRLCVTYGVRAAPYRMCAKLSNDGGKSWCDEVVLRDDGASHDMGYPRSVQRPDGKVVTIYYFCDDRTGAERYIAATIWDPDSISQ